MDHVDWKLRPFYQSQIATIAKLTKKQTQPAARNRLNFLLNQYIDMLLVMPSPSERKSVETTAQPVSLVTRQPRRRHGIVSQAGRREPGRRLGASADGQIGQNNPRARKLPEGAARIARPSDPMRLL